jgi:peptidyl-dipeptidase A
MKRLFTIIIILIVLFGCSRNEKAEYLLSHFISSHEKDLEHLHKEDAKALWENYTSNNAPDDYYYKTDSIHRTFDRKTEAELNIRALYNNISEYDFLNRMKQSGLVENPVLKREMDKLYDQYAWARHDFYTLNDKQAQLANRFYVLEKSKPGDEDIQYLGSDSMLMYDTRRNELLSDYKEIVREKNSAAKKAGFINFWSYWLDKNELESDEQEKLVSAIDSLTRDDYLQFKHTIDSFIVKHKGITADKITYSDFYLYVYKMTHPEMLKIKMSEDSVERTLICYFNEKGFMADSIYANSEIWWQKNKIRGSFVINMNNKDDVRIYGCFMPQFWDMVNLLHETGHAFYFKNVSPEIPFTLREPNLAMNEAVGFVFQSLFIADPELKKRFGLSATGSEYFSDLKMPYMLFITRDLLVRAELEKEIIRNPDQDINKLFWELKKKYFFYDQPDVDKVPLWIQDTHIIHNSGVYQTYLYAAAISGMLLEEVKYNPKYGKWLSQNIFRYGDSERWRDILQNATGEPFTPKYISNIYK